MNLFKLFDGSFSGAGSAVISNQSDTSFSDITYENDYISQLASGSEQLELLVDYSDFKNFITFNSAKSYVEISAEQILNFNIDKPINEIFNFIESLDGYQKYFLKNWPTQNSHLRFNEISSSYIKFDDFGYDNGISKSSFLSPFTGSLTISCCADLNYLTSSDGASVILQKKKLDSSDGYTLFVSASSVFFEVISGSSSAIVSSSINYGPMFIDAVIDRYSDTGSLKLYVGSTSSNPQLIDQKNLIIGNRYDLFSSSFFIGSGTIPGKNINYLSGNLYNLNIWSNARNIQNITGSYNKKVYAQNNLIASYRFNEISINSTSNHSKIIKDYSGHRLDGRIINFYNELRSSGTVIDGTSDPILLLDDSNVYNYVSNLHASGTEYDRNNQNVIWNIFPSAFSSGQDESSSVFKNFALIMARLFDKIKLYIEHLQYLKIVNYDNYKQTPDELLNDVASFFGWDFSNHFSSIKAMEYLDGKNLNLYSNNSLKIKNELLRRTLQNLSYIYKTKGTKESIESIIRIYGFDNNFIKVKESSIKPFVALKETSKAASRSVYTLKFSSGSQLTFSAAPIHAYAYLSSSISDFSVVSYVSSSMLSISISPTSSVIFS